MKKQQMRNSTGEKNKGKRGREMDHPNKFSQISLLRIHNVHFANTHMASKSHLCGL